MSDKADHAPVDERAGSKPRIILAFLAESSPLSPGQLRRPGGRRPGVTIAELAEGLQQRVANETDPMSSGLAD